MPDSLSPSSRLKTVKPLAPELEARTAEYWRSRAEEARAVGAQMSDELTLQTIENIAASYDKLAGWAERKQG